MGWDATTGRVARDGESVYLITYTKAFNWSMSHLVCDQQTRTVRALAQE